MLVLKEFGSSVRKESSCSEREEVEEAEVREVEREELCRRVVEVAGTGI